MSEHIGTVSEIPKIEDSYEKIEFNRDIRGRIVVYGIDDRHKRSRLKEDDALLWLGHDPEAWTVYNQDWQAWDYGGRQAYLSERGLPYASAETLSLRKENGLLKAELENLQAEKQQLNEQIQAQSTAIANLERALEALQRRVNKLDPDYQPVKAQAVREGKAIVLVDTMEEKAPPKRTPPIKPAPIVTESEPTETVEVQETNVVTTTESRPTWRQRAAELLLGRRAHAYLVSRQPKGEETIIEENVTVESKQRRPGLLAGALGGAAIVGLAWWLSSRGNHDLGEAVLNQRINNLEVDHTQLSTELTNLKTDLTSQITEAKAQVIDKVTAQHVHQNFHHHLEGSRLNELGGTIDHLHDVQDKHHGLLTNLIRREDAEAAASNGYSGGSEKFAGYQYPWDWAEATAGEGRGSSLLFSLTERAQADGHDVEWHNINSGSYNRAWLEINGRSDTGYVLSVLNKYR